MPRIDELDSTARCTWCNHFYHRPNGREAKQLPLHHVEGVGPVCDGCDHEVLSPRWPDEVVRAVDGVAAEMGLA